MGNYPVTPDCILAGLGGLERKELAGFSAYILAAKVSAIIPLVAVVVRNRDDSDPEYRKNMRCEQWEVIVPELVFEPQ